MSYRVLIGCLVYVDLTKAEATLLTFLFETMGHRCIVIPD
jgi:hypothetical protein